jgi:hypothetical protein
MKHLIIFNIIFLANLLCLASGAGFNAETDVKFLLYSRNNPNIPQNFTYSTISQLLSSSFDSNKQTRFICHGWNDAGTSGFAPLMKNAFLQAVDVNLFVVDWSLGANTPYYPDAQGRVPSVGLMIARFVDFIKANYNVDLQTISMVGHSLGAHAIGFAGKQITSGKVNVLVGLDPAAPLFDLNNPATRIAVGDARYVEIIHTDIGVVGIGGPIGNATYYPNGGGAYQPGCDIMQLACSHIRATDYFTESLNSNRFVARSCQDEFNARWTSWTCSLCSSCIMGGDPLLRSKSINGVYYLKTNSQSPFARGLE